jgi:hypothetical protein
MVIRSYPWTINVFLSVASVWFPNGLRILLYS